MCKPYEWYINQSLCICRKWMTAGKVFPKLATSLQQIHIQGKFPQKRCLEQRLAPQYFYFLLTWVTTVVAEAAAASCGSCCSRAQGTTRTSSICFLLLAYFHNCYYCNFCQLTQYCCTVCAPNTFQFCSCQLKGEKSGGFSICLNHCCKPHISIPSCSKYISLSLAFCSFPSSNTSFCPHTLSPV